MIERALQQDVPNISLTEGTICEIQQIPLHGFCYDPADQTVLQRLKLDKQTLEYACLDMQTYQVVYVPPGYPVEFTAAKRKAVLPGEALALLKDVHSRYGGYLKSELNNDIVWHKYTPEVRLIPGALYLLWWLGEYHLTEYSRGEPKVWYLSKGGPFIKPVPGQYFALIKMPEDE